MSGVSAPEREEDPFQGKQKLPRDLPLATVLNAYLSGPLSQMGWAFLAFSLCFFWAFGADTAIWEASLTVRSWGRTSGTFLGSGATSLSINHKRVYAGRFRYQVLGENYEGVSYSSQQSFLRSASTSQELKIEYLESDPEVARIVGTRLSRSPLFIVLPLGLFLGIGVAFAGYGLYRGRRRHHLLERGRLTVGRRASKEATSTRVNEQRVYRFTYRYRDEMGRLFEAEARSHKTKRLEDEELERILFDPNDPQVSEVVDSFGYHLLIDHLQGKVHGDSGIPGSAFLPALTILGHGAVFVTRWWL